jgi:hypothetical protein
METQTTQTNEQVEREEDWQTRSKVFTNAIGDYIVRPFNTVENLQVLCKHLGIPVKKNEDRFMFGFAYCDVKLNNFSLYELQKSDISLEDYSKHTNHQGRALFAHFPVNLAIRLSANKVMEKGLVTQLGFGGLDIAITSWKTSGETEEYKRASLFGVAQPRTYAEGSNLYFNLYDRAKFSETIRNMPLYGVSLHVESFKKAELNLGEKQ